MQEEEIFEKLADVFEQVMDTDVALTPSLTADDVPEWDSLSHVRLIITVERTFRVKFAASEVTGLKNLGDLVSLIKKHGG